MDFKILSFFLIFSLGILVLMPQSFSVLENDQYTLDAKGFIVTQNSIENSEIFINFEIIDSIVGKKFEFKNGLLIISGNELPISSNLQARLLKNGDLIRLSGLVSSGDRFTILGKSMEESKDGSVFSIIGVLISEDGVRKKIAYSGVISNKIKMIQPELQEEKIIEEKEFKIITSHTKTREIKQTYEIKIRSYESGVEPPSDFTLNQGVLEGVNITVKITDLEGKVIKQFNGITDSQGYFIDKFQIPSNIRTGKYMVDVLAQIDSTVLTEQLELFITEGQ